MDLGLVGLPITQEEKSNLSVCLSVCLLVCLLVHIMFFSFVTRWLHSRCQASATKGLRLRRGSGEEPQDVIAVVVSVTRYG